MSNDRILDRIEKLRRLAAASSNSTEAERASAALEMVRLMEEHDVAVKREHEAEEEKKKRVAKNVWVLSVALHHVSCSHCCKVIAPRDIIWIRVMPDNRVEYRHKYKPCTVE